MIWIIGGTSEAREVMASLKQPENILVTVTTAIGQERLPAGDVKIKKMDQEQMRSFILDHKIQICVDLSHPFAALVSQNAKTACQELGVQYLRYHRKEDTTHNIQQFSTLFECASFIQGLKECVFFTTGSKNITEFEAVRGKNRFVYRILPARQSLIECEKNDIKVQDIIAVLGPFSKQMNMAMFNEYQAKYVVMKDSGKPGGMKEKIEACHDLQIEPLLILQDKKRQDDDSGNTTTEPEMGLEQLIQFINNHHA